MEKAINSIDVILVNKKDQLQDVENNLNSSKIELEKPFEHEEERSKKLKKQLELNTKLNVDSSKNDETSDITKNTETNLKSKYTITEGEELER